MCGSRDNLVLHQASSEVYQCSSMILRMCQSEEVERLRGMMFSDICRLMTMMQRCSGRDRAATRSTHGGHDSWVETVMSRRFHVPRFSLFLHLFRHYCLFRLSYHLSFLLLFPLCIKHHLKLDQGLFFISLVRPTSTPIGSPSSHQKIKYALPRILPSRPISVRYKDHNTLRNHALSRLSHLLSFSRKANFQKASSSSHSTHCFDLTTRGHLSILTLLSLCTTSGCLCGFHTTDKLILAWYLSSYCSSRHAIACG